MGHSAVLGSKDGICYDALQRCYEVAEVQLRRAGRWLIFERTEGSIVGLPWDDLLGGGFVQ